MANEEEAGTDTQAGSTGERADSAPRSGALEAAGPVPVVVVGVDGSEASSKALAWAAEEASLRGATLRIVQAWFEPAGAYPTYMPAESFEKAPLDARKSLEEQVSRVLPSDPGVRVEQVVGEGPPAEVILSKAEDATLVVVGSRGRGGFAGLLLGSTSGEVAHRAHCPVTIVRP